MVERVPENKVVDFIDGRTLRDRKPEEHVRQNIATSDAGPLDKSLLAELKKHRWDRTPQRWSD